MKRNITVIYNASESDQEVLLEGEVDALPYIIQFNKPFSFFQLKQSYNITFSVEDNDGQKDEFTIRYELKNKQLLIIIIAARIKAINRFCVFIFRILSDKYWLPPNLDWNG